MVVPWVPSSGRWATSATWAATGCSTRNSSEFPSDAVASSLSDILETGPVPEKYFLSPKAATGILRRAQTRGRSLPPALDAALGTVASAYPEDSEDLEEDDLEEMGGLGLEEEMEMEEEEMED